MKACIFDLDGTLTDTLESLVYSVNESLKEMGLSAISDRQCESFVGNGARYLMERSLEAAGDMGAARIEEAMQVYGRIFGANCTYHVTPYDGIPEMLNALKENGVRLAVLSNKPHSQTVNVVQTIFGKECFDYIQGQTDSIPRKPDPAGVYYLIEKMGVPKTECLYIGDSEVDIATGKAAGVKSIGVEWGFRSRQVLVDAGAEHIISAPDQLLQFIIS
ncbi:MAG: HAD family hydrolase [Eubacteriales bacterium]|nr:HAD family hydrolase [Eubacteriales bacterium]